jgi:O-antigen/teichoic acid export membrane protein
MVKWPRKLLLCIESFISKGHSRSIKAKRNILASFIIQGCSIIISFLLLPITIDYINPSRYGIWLTLSAVVAWFSFFDIGLTQGLRNKFAIAKANGEHDKAQAYVSTAYAILGIIFTVLWVVFIFVNQFLDWTKVLNVSSSLKSEVTILAVIVFTYFCLQFTLKIVSTILVADQQPAKSALIDLVSQALAMLIIIILVRTTREGSLINLGMAFCASPIIVLLIANISLFRGKYKRYKPTFAKIKFSQAKELFNLGMVFFIIQVAGIIQFQTANIIIAQHFGTAEVTSYNIVYRYFGITNMLFTIFLNPFWSASTEAYLKNEIQWIRNGIRKYNLLNVGLIIIGFLMLVFSDSVYNLWLGKGKVNIPFSLSLWAFVYFNVTIFGGKYVSFLNGISALRIQLWACIVSPFFYIATALILIKYFHFGVFALFIASVVANFNSYLLAPLQYYKIIVKGKRGLWIR